MYQNAFYGATGQSSCIYYNLHIAPSITAQGQSANSASVLSMEAFIANNVKFRSLNEVVTFIHNVIGETYDYTSDLFIDNDIDVAVCFEKIVLSCGHGYLPSEEHLDIIWDIVHRQTQEIINRLFYKNNLFAFMDNSSMKKAVLMLLENLEEPYLDPNHAPKSIAPELDEFWNILKNFVFYNYGYIDRIERVAYLPRKVSVALDTDSL